MLRTFKVERFHASLIPKSTLFKALRYLDREKIETPFLLIDSDTVKEKVSLIGRSIKNSKVFYAVKANPDREILRFLNKLKLGFEISSEGELEILTSLGVEPERIISSNPIKSLKFLNLASSYGINYFSYDSEDEIKKLSKYFIGKKLGGAANDGALKLFPALCKMTKVHCSKVEITNMQPNLREQMLMQGQVDGVFGYVNTIRFSAKLIGVPDDKLRYINFGDHGMDLYSNAIIVSKKLDPPSYVLGKANERRVPVFRTPMSTTPFIHSITEYLTVYFAPRDALHASLVDVYGVGAVHRTQRHRQRETALDLVERGHRPTVIATGEPSLPACPEVRKKERYLNRNGFYRPEQSATGFER